MSKNGQANKDKKEEDVEQNKKDKTAAKQAQKEKEKKQQQPEEGNKDSSGSK